MKNQPLTSLETSAGIGIWRKKNEAGRVIFKRDPADRPSWSEWANTEVLYSKSTKRRVVLLGESVARGYFYDPYYNVAQELEATLNGIPEGRDIEVIDLAKTSLVFTELLELIRSSALLDPDMVIVFAGNNWEQDIRSSLRDHSNNSILESFRQLGLEGVNRFLEMRAEDMIRELFSAIGDNLIKRGIRVIYIVPEFNLKDWKSDDKENALPWMPEGYTEKWMATKEDALEALRANDTERLGVASAKMVALFPSNPMSHELSGLFHFLSGNYTQARDCFGRSRDAVLLSGAKPKPRCFKMIRDQLLHQAGQNRIEIIDLASIFERAYPAHVSDRHEFLDYCHLTVEGIKTAMRYTAQKVTELLYGKKIEIDRVPASELFPDKQASAIAHFSAAIHNAHSGQPEELLQYHCSKAIQYSSNIRDIMLKFVDFSTRKASSQFCASYVQLIHNGSMYQYEGGRSLMHPPGKKLMDISLIDAITSSLRTVSPGIGIEVDRLRKSEHGITAQGIDLLEPFYCKTHYNEYIDESDTGLYQARTLDSDFHFVIKRRSDPMLFELSCRLPGAGTSKRLIGVRLNGDDRFVARLPVSSDWITHSFIVREEYLVDGVNKLSIKWPYVHRAMAKDIPTTYNGILKLVFPVIGEISSFVARLSLEEPV